MTQHDKYYHATEPETGRLVVRFGSESFTLEVVADTLNSLAPGESFTLTFERAFDNHQDEA